MATKELNCAHCSVLNCSTRAGEFPPFCPTTSMDPEFKAEVLAKYEGINREIMLTAARVELENYCKFSRVEETMDFARRMGYKKLGVATCVGLIRETRMLAKILEHNGFEVYGVACKIGSVEKTDLGIYGCEEVGKRACNPIMQAEVLNREKTDMNIVMGLCVGHDSLFYKYSKAVTTTLVVKDRVTGHNPVAAIYNAESYYRKKVFAPK